jgi:hypothetical protein
VSEGVRELALLYIGIRGVRVLVPLWPNNVKNVPYERPILESLRVKKKKVYLSMLDPYWMR